MRQDLIKIHMSFNPIIFSVFDLFTLLFLAPYRIVLTCP